jgi:hypothetical protein
LGAAENAAPFFYGIVAAVNDFDVTSKRETAGDVPAASG